MPKVSPLEAVYVDAGAAPFAQIPVEVAELLVVEGVTLTELFDAEVVETALGMLAEALVELPVIDAEEVVDIPEPDEIL